MYIIFILLIVLGLGCFAVEYNVAKYRGDMRFLYSGAMLTVIGIALIIIKTSIKYVTL